jgi:hypothetical protein
MGLAILAQTAVHFLKDESNSPVNKEGKAYVS